MSGPPSAISTCSSDPRPCPRSDRARPRAAGHGGCSRRPTSVARTSSQNRMAPSKRSGLSAYGRGLEPDQSIEQPADERTLRTARTPALPLASGRQHARRAIARQDPEVDVRELGPMAVVGLVPVPEAVCHQVGVHGDQAGPCMERKFQHRDVAEAQHRLGVGFDRRVVDQVEIRQRRLAAGQREDRPNLRIPQEPVELLGNLRRRRGSPPPLPGEVDQRRNADFESHPLDGFDPPLELFRLTLVQSAGQGRHGNDIARPQRLRTQDRRHVEPPFLGRDGHPASYLGSRYPCPTMPAESRTTVVRLRIVVTNPPTGTGTSFGIQDKSGALHPDASKSKDAVAFECEVKASDGGHGSEPNFLGPFTHGPPKARFLYISHRRDGAAGWIKRIKVPLSSITWSMIEAAARRRARDRGRRSLLRHGPRDLAPDLLTAATLTDHASRIHLHRVQARPALPARSDGARGHLDLVLPGRQDRRHRAERRRQVEPAADHGRAR